MTITEVCRATNLSAQRLLDWERRGFVKPHLQRRGRRIIRLYPEDLVLRIARIKEHCEAGYRLSKAAELASLKPLNKENNHDDRA